MGTDENTSAITGTGATGSRPRPLPTGVLLGFEPTIGDVVSIATDAEAAGVESVYLVEATRSASVPLAAVAAATDRVRIGTYVVNAYARSPWLTGMVARDLHELSGGRMVLGIGTGNVHMNDWYMGLDSSKPMAKMRDHLDIVTAMVAAEAGGRVQHDGDLHRMYWAATHRIPDAPLPVYLSASGPNMIALAAQHSDGIGTGIMASPEHLRDTVRPLARQAAEAVGKDPDSLAFPTGAWISVNEERELARAAARFAICGLFHPVPHPYYDHQLRAQGFSDVADSCAELMPAGKTRQAMDLVPDECVDALTISGTPDECRARLEEYEGVADELVALRVGQRGDTGTAGDYRLLLDVISA